MINIDGLIEILVQHNNLYSPQNWRKFLTNAQEMKVIIGVNYDMTINQLSSISLFWDCNHFVGNVGIQNITLLTTQNKTKQIKTILLDSSITWMNLFKQYFQMSLCKTKFKGRSWFSSWQMKFYNNDINGVDIMDQKPAACRLDRKSKYCFYFSMFFDLMDSHM